MKKIFIVILMLSISKQGYTQMIEEFKSINLNPYEGSWEYSSDNSDSIYFRVDVKLIKDISLDRKYYSYSLWGNYLYKDKIRFESNICKMKMDTSSLCIDYSNVTLSAFRVYSKCPEFWIGFDSSYVNLRFQDQLYKKPGEGRITWINDSTLHWQLEEPRDIILLEEGSYDGPGFSVPTNVILRRRKK